MTPNRQIDLNDKFEDVVLESPAPGDMVSYICTLGVWHKFRSDITILLSDTPTRSPGPSILSVS